MQEVQYAMQAMNYLQNYILLSSDRGGIRIEYAKNRMGESTSEWLSKYIHLV